jgi:membrane-associated phospholipid phosphatase
LSWSSTKATRWNAGALALLLVAGAAPAGAEEPVPAHDPGATEPAATTAPVPPPPARPRLTIDMSTNAWVTGGLLAFTGATQYYADELSRSACQWCTPGPFDVNARSRLVWGDIASAGTASDVTMVALPVADALALFFMARADKAGGREVTEDLLVFTEGVAVATALMQVAKFSTLRLRPDSWAAGGGTSSGSRMSFWAGHASSAFAMAAGATQVARMRGRAGWGWLAAASFAGAATVGYLRIAADRHWTTDVMVGAVVGTASGLVVPLLVFHQADERKPAVTLVPAPGGLALIF